MGMCKKCGEVFNTNDMIDGYCKNCTSDLNFGKDDISLEYKSKLMETYAKEKAEQNQPSTIDKDKLFAIIIMTILIISILATLRSCSSSTSEEIALPEATGTEVKEEIKKIENWAYSSGVDKMSEKESKYAQTTSTNVEYLNFPYDGGTSMDIIIRNHPRMGTDAYITVNKGQLNKSSYDGNSIMIKFDGEKAKQYSVNEPSDNSSDTFFINNHKSFISKLKKSNSVIVEVEFYNDGIRQFEFNTTNFVWK